MSTVSLLILRLPYDFVQLRYCLVPVTVTDYIICTQRNSRQVFIWNSRSQSCHTSTGQQQRKINYSSAPAARLTGAVVNTTMAAEQHCIDFCHRNPTKQTARPITIAFIGTTKGGIGSILDGSHWSTPQYLPVNYNTV